MPLGASRLSFLAKTAAEAAVEQRTALTVTGYGDAQIDTAQSKFGGSSIRLDGTGDFLNAVNSGGTDIDFGTGDFTVEGFIQFNTAPSGDEALIVGPAQTGSLYIQFFNSLIRVGRTNTAWDATSSSVSISTGVWYHWAVSRTSGTMEIYFNGSRIYNAANTNSYRFASGQIRIGSYLTSNPPTANAFYFIDGWMDEIRISNTSRYTGSSLTVPTSAFVNDSTTELLLHADGTDGDTVFIDDNGDRAPVGISATNASINTSSSKIGNSSVKLDTSGGRVQLNDLRTAIDLNSDWTIEFWYRTPGNSGFDMLAGQWGSGSQGYRTIFIGLNNGSQPTFYYTDSSNSTSTFTGSNATYANDTWHHYAVVATGSDIKIYINGSQDGSLGSRPTFTNDSVYEFTLFENFNDGDAAVANTYIDELRVSQTARYTAGFTPSTTAFENDSNTLLLLHAEQHDADTTVIFDDNGATLPSYTPPASWGDWASTTGTLISQPTVPSAYGGHRDLMLFNFGDDSSVYVMGGTNASSFYDYKIYRWTLSNGTLTYQDRTDWTASYRQVFTRCNVIDLPEYNKAININDHEYTVLTQNTSTKAVTVGTDKSWNASAQTPTTTQCFVNPDDSTEIVIAENDGVLYFLSFANSTDTLSTTTKTNLSGSLSNGQGFIIDEGGTKKFAYGYLDGSNWKVYKVNFDGTSGSTTDLGTGGPTLVCYAYKKFEDAASNQCVWAFDNDSTNIPIMAIVWNGSSFTQGSTTNLTIDATDSAGDGINNTRTGHGSTWTRENNYHFISVHMDSSGSAPRQEKFALIEVNASTGATTQIGNWIDASTISEQASNVRVGSRATSDAAYFITMSDDGNTDRGDGIPSVSVITRD
jgi:hypothetical protein